MEVTRDSLQFSHCLPNTWETPNHRPGSEYTLPAKLTPPLSPAGEMRLKAWVTPPRSEPLLSTTSVTALPQATSSLTWTVSQPNWPPGLQARPLPSSGGLAGSTCGIHEWPRHLAPPSLPRGPVFILGPAHEALQGLTVTLRASPVCKHSGPPCRALVAASPALAPGRGTQPCHHSPNACHHPP